MIVSVSRLLTTPVFQTGSGLHGNETGSCMCTVTMTLCIASYVDVGKLTSFVKVKAYQNWLVYLSYIRLSVDRHYPNKVSPVTRVIYSVLCVTVNR